MFTVKLKELITFKDNYEKYSQLCFPIKTSFIISKIGAIAESEFEFYQNKIREIIDECAEKDEDGNYVFDENTNNLKLKNDKITDFHDKTSDLYEIQIEIPCEKISLDSLDSISIDPATLQPLIPFIEE